MPHGKPKGDRVTLIAFWGIHFRSAMRSTSPSSLTLLAVASERDILTLRVGYLESSQRS